MPINQKQKVLKIIKSCQTIEQIQTTRKWVKTLKIEDKDELYLETLYQSNLIIKQSFRTLNSTLFNIRNLIQNNNEREVFELK